MVRGEKHRMGEVFGDAPLTCGFMTLHAKSWDAMGGTRFLSLSLPPSQLSSGSLLAIAPQENAPGIRLDFGSEQADLGTHVKTHM